MKNANDMKERAIQEVRNQLEAKRIRVEDESAQQERSEPESTFSDLTDSSVSAKTPGKVDSGAKSDANEDDKINNSKKSQGTALDGFAPINPVILRFQRGENEAKTAVTDSTLSSKDNNSRSTSSSNAATGSFKLDFQEVFIKSNIPQLLATDSGKIVSWNAFFLEITGLEPKELQRLSIFSLVPSRELAKLFEFVAKALGSRPYTQEVDSEACNRETSITLPCVRFPREASDENTSLPLSMTVTMMPNLEPRKQCFHVVFSDQSGGKGTMGSIPPDLLALLFARPRESNPLFSLRKVHKKRKQPA